MILVRGGHVDLTLTSGKTIVTPKGYGLIQDVSGDWLDKCSLFIGPVRVSRKCADEIPNDARDWFGPDYVVRLAMIDVPDGKWNLSGHVKEIVYYRPGKLEGDWHHEFSKPQPLFTQKSWYQIELPDDCKVTWRGIERP
jgi:hypothetical protein